MASDERQIAVNPAGAETGIFDENWASIISVDDLAPCVARSSATMVLIMHDTPVDSPLSSRIRTSCVTDVLRNDRKSSNGSDHEGAAVLLPGFAINW